MTTNRDEKHLESIFKRYLRLHNFIPNVTPESAVSSNSSTIKEIVEQQNANDLLQVIDFDECNEWQYNDCSINAKCFNLPGTFTCSCMEHFIDASVNSHLYPGRNCIEELTGCEYCHYHGKCLTEQNSELPSNTCECFPWYMGSRCMVNLKILLIVLVVKGAILLILLTFCIMVMAHKRQRQQQQYHHSVLVPSVVTTTAATASIISELTPTGSYQQSLKKINAATKHQQNIARLKLYSDQRTLHSTTTTMERVKTR